MILVLDGDNLTENRTLFLMSTAKHYTHRNTDVMSHEERPRKRPMRSDMVSVDNYSDLVEGVADVPHMDHGPLTAVERVDMANSQSVTMPTKKTMRTCFVDILPDGKEQCAAEMWLVLTKYVELRLQFQL